MGVPVKASHAAIQMDSINKPPWKCFIAHMAPRYPTPQTPSSEFPARSTIPTPARFRPFRLVVCCIFCPSVRVLLRQDGSFGGRAGHQAQGVRARTPGCRARSREQQGSAGVPVHARQRGVGAPDDLLVGMIVPGKEPKRWMSRDTFPRNAVLSPTSRFTAPCGVSSGT